MLKSIRAATCNLGKRLRFWLSASRTGSKAQIFFNYANYYVTIYVYYTDSLPIIALRLLIFFLISLPSKPNLYEKSTVYLFGPHYFIFIKAGIGRY